MTALDLLYKILDFRNWEGSFERYHLNALADKKPSFVRLQQIECLLAAFQLTKEYINPSLQIFYGNQKTSRKEELSKLSNLQYFLNGEFIKDREYQNNNQELIYTTLEVAKRLTYLDAKYFKKEVHIGWLFNSLITYRTEIHRFTQKPKFFDEGFEVGAYYAMYLKTELSKDLIKNLQEIDQTLSLIIDPIQRIFSLEELQSKYNYIEFDLEQIDLEWRNTEDY
jgi:hypothetical protein